MKKEAIRQELYLIREDLVDKEVKDNAFKRIRKIELLLDGFYVEVKSEVYVNACNACPFWDKGKSQVGDFIGRCNHDDAPERFRLCFAKELPDWCPMMK